MAELNLDQEEKDILESYERGEWKSVKMHRFVTGRLIEKPRSNKSLENDV